MPDPNPIEAENPGGGFVDLIAQLLSNPVSLGQLQSAPEKFLQDFQLTSEERHAILTLNPDSLHEQARTLTEKRWHEITKLIPLTLQDSDQNLKEVFEFYASKYWPADDRRHLVDALKFLMFLEQNEIMLPNKSEKKDLKNALQ